MRVTCLCMLFFLSPLLVQSQLQGRAKLDSMLSRLPYVAQDTSKGELLTAIAFEYGMISPDSGLMYAGQALAHAGELGWARGIFKAYQNIGINYLSKGDYPTALEYHYKAREVEELNPGRIKPGKVLINIMLCHHYMDDHVAALDVGLEAMRIFEAHHDTVSLAKILGNLALVYASLGEYEKSIEHHRGALDLYIFMGNKDGQGRALGNMGIAYQALKRYNEALEHDLAALALYEELGQRRGTAINLLNIGGIHRELDQLTPALERLEHALHLARELGDNAMIGVCMANMGMVYYRSTEMDAIALDGPLLGMSIDRRLQMARDLLQEGMELIEPTGHKQVLKESAFILSKVYVSLGMPWEALNAHQKGAALRDSILTEDKLVRITRLQAQRDRELYDKDLEIRSIQLARTEEQRGYLIAILSFLALFIVVLVNRHRLKIRKDKALLKLQEKSMQMDKQSFEKQLIEIEMRALRAQMDPHFIFNCLNAIQTMILAQDHQDASGYLQKFSRLIRLILDNARKHSTTVEDEMDILSLYLDLEQLRLQDKFTYSIVRDPAIDAHGTEFPSMVVQPLVENSLWHGIMLMDGRGSLTVTFEKHEDELLCVVADDGVGRERARALDQRTGHHSKGIQLIRDRLEAWGRTRGVRCQLDIDDPADGRGTRTVIRIGLTVDPSGRDPIDDQLEKELASLAIGTSRE